MEQEIWKPITGYEGYYEISSLGRVKRLSRYSVDSMGRRVHYSEKILNTHISNTTGYLRVNLSKNNITESKFVHALIADAFIPNPSNLPCINHIDENRANSVLSNLERCTYSYNNLYGSAIQKRRATYLQNHPNVNVKHDIETQQKQLKKAPNKGRKFDNIQPKKHQKYVIKLNENGQEIARYKSVSEASVANGFDRHYFSKNVNEEGYATIKGERYCVEKKENEYIPIGHKGPRPDLKGKCAKVICQYSKEGGFIREFASIKEAAAFLGVPKATPEISNCCNGKLKTARGYIWRYKGDDAPKPFTNELTKAIAQYSLNGELLAMFNSIREAAQAVDGSGTGIGNVLAGRSHSAYGFIWKYAN